MSFKKIYELSGGNYGTTYSVEIYLDTAATVSVDTLELTNCTGSLGSNETELDYPFIASVWSLEIIDKDYTNNGYVYDTIKDNDPEDLRIDIYKGSFLLFRGIPTLTGFTRKYDPVTGVYDLTIKAIDGFGALKGQAILTSSSIDLYESIQEALDLIGHGFDTRWYVELENLEKNPSFIPEGYYATGSGSAYELLRTVLNLYGFRIFQRAGQWIIIEESYIGEITQPSGQLLSRYINWYQVESSTYTTSSGQEQIGFTGSPVYANANYADDSFQDGAKIDLHPALSSATVQYALVPGASPFIYQRQYFRAEIDTTVTSSTPVTDDWNSAITPDLNVENSVDIDIAITANTKTTGLTANTSYSADVLEAKFITPSQTYWLKEDGTWATTQTKFDVVFITDGSGNPIANPVSISLVGIFDFPSTSEAGYLTVSLFLDDPDNGYVSVEGDLTIEVDGPLELVKAIARNPYTGRDSSISLNTGIETTNEFDPVDVNWVSTERDYKLAETTALKKVARQHKQMQKFTGVLNEITTPILYGVFLLSDFSSTTLYRILYINYNLFEEKSEVAFVEWDYDETNITVDRGIYS